MLGREFKKWRKHRMNNNIEVIGIDHGWSQMKTSNTCFNTSIKELANAPAFHDNVLEYDDRYFAVGEERLEVLDSKVENENFYLLTLVAMAKELEIRGKSEADVVLAVGLPLTRFSAERKQNIYQLDKFNDDYNFYGFVSQIEEKGNKKASIINYIISEEDLIKNHSFKIINFFHDLLDKQKLLMYNQIGVRGVLLNCENTDIKDAEIIFEMIEECQLDWVVIGGGEHISIGQRRYEKFVNKINNKSNWTPISL